MRITLTRGELQTLVDCCVFEAEPDFNESVPAAILMETGMIEIGEADGVARPTSTGFRVLAKLALRVEMDNLEIEI